MYSFFIFTLKVFVNFAKEQMDQQEEVLKNDDRRLPWRRSQYKTLDESDLCLDETDEDDEEFLLKYATFKVRIYTLLTVSSRTYVVCKIEIAGGQLKISRVALIPC